MLISHELTVPLPVVLGWKAVYKHYYSQPPVV